MNLQFHQKLAYLTRNIFIAEPSLNEIENLVGVMRKLQPDQRREVWGKVLGWDCEWIPESLLNEVYVKHTTDEEKAHVLADVYINIRPESSWQDLLKTLYDEGELAAAKEAKSFLQQAGM